MSVPLLTALCQPFCCQGILPLISLISKSRIIWWNQAGGNFKWEYLPTQCNSLLLSSDFDRLERILPVLHKQCTKLWQVIYLGLRSRTMERLWPGTLLPKNEACLAGFLAPAQVQVAPWCACKWLQKDCNCKTCQEILWPSESVQCACITVTFFKKWSCCI